MTQLQAGSRSPNQAPDPNAPAFGQTPETPGSKAVSTPSRHISKVTVAWLASLLGVLGAHWWYLGRRRAWMITSFTVLMLILSRFYASGWDNPPFLLLVIPATEGFIEALVFALKPDDQFDAKYNPGSGRTTHTGWNAVLAAIFTTLAGTFVLTWGIAFMVMYVYVSMGWLDGYVL
jgi:hypothetical protein